MATISFKGSPIHTVGELPEVGSEAPEVTVTGTDLVDVPIDGSGTITILDIFPSIDTGVCAASVRRFNEIAANRPGTRVLTVSQDLPYALRRFCGAEGIEHAVATSAFRSDFGERFGVRMTDGVMRGLLARSVVVLDADGTVRYTQLVPEISHEPDYDAVLAALD